MTYIYGIGRASATRILAEAGVSPDTRVRDLTDEEVKKISAVIDATQTVEGDYSSIFYYNIFLNEATDDGFHPGAQMGKYPFFPVLMAMP